MLDGLTLDPHTVLGVARGASAEEVRDAYHRKSKRYHPDVGGDEWAFRIVVRAYEILSEPAAEPVPPAPRVAGVSPADEPPDTGRIRMGVVDKGVEPIRRVQVEMIWMRYEVADFLELLSEPTEDRNLSGSLHIIWPDPELTNQAARMPQADRILRALNAAFDDLRARTRPLSARSEINQGRFEAMLGYSDGPTAGDAFKLFHHSLKARGLGVRQWTRDVTVPREPVG